MKTSRSNNRTAQSAEATPHCADPGTFRPLLRGRLRRCGGLGWTVAGVPPGSALETAIVLESASSLYAALNGAGALRPYVQGTDDVSHASISN